MNHERARRSERSGRPSGVSWRAYGTTKATREASEEGRATIEHERARRGERERTAGSVSWRASGTTDAAREANEEGRSLNISEPDVAGGVAGRGGSTACRGTRRAGRPASEERCRQ
ncbi:hypothetical protein GCM10029978_103010 [Actinoallomurus acanthiterrae]